MNLSFYLIVFIFGACVGSFLNCLIYRLREKESFLSGRSFCPKCRHKLGFFDLIPILSFIFLKGKCRYCSKRISLQYPMVEIATGGVFLLIFNFQNFTTTLYLLIISCFLIIIFVYDLKHYIIPDKIIYPAIVITFLYRVIFNFQTSNLYSSILSALAASGFFFLIWLVSRGKWMGLGDAKLAFFMGLFLGYPQILPALFSAFLIGAIIGLGLIAFGKKSLKSQVPFGPFLVAGSFIALFWGEQIIRWYINSV
ncbi:prepilin peptidase [Patescibacteria group bacterium]|nr:prepilin peptidase [Patescibacteria group bacterium]